MSNDTIANPQGFSEFLATLSNTDGAAPPATAAAIEAVQAKLAQQQADLFEKRAMKLYESVKHGVEALRRQRAAVKQQEKDLAKLNDAAARLAAGTLTEAEISRLDGSIRSGCSFYAYDLG